MHEPHGAPPSGKVLEAMLMTRRQMNRCIERFDALVYTPHERGFTERGLARFCWTRGARCDELHGAHAPHPKDPDDRP
jgi:hypothetical protein